MVVVLEQERGEITGDIYFLEGAEILEAVTGMRRHCREMRLMVLMVEPGEKRTALARLVGWYERVCVDESYCRACPQEGLDAIGHPGDRIGTLEVGDSEMVRRVVAVARQVVEVRLMSAGSGSQGKLVLSGKLWRLHEAIGDWFSEREGLIGWAESTGA